MSQLALIAAAFRAIGAAIARLMAAGRWHVVLVVRDASGLQDVANVVGRVGTRRALRRSRRWRRRGQGGLFEHVAQRARPLRQW